MNPSYSTPVEKILNGDVSRRSSKTFKLDWDNKRILTKTVDKLDAVAQAIDVRCSVEWLRFDVMPDTFGLELKKLYNTMGEAMPRGYVLANLERLIKECLSPDLRIKKIEDFKLREDGHDIYCNFVVVCEEGSFEKEVVINV